MARATRELQYKDYESPRFSLTEPLQYLSGAVNLKVSATDCLDGDITSAIKLQVKGAITTDQPGKYESAFQVANCAGDVSREWLTILMVTLCSGLIAYMAQSSTYKPVYRTQTTMVITATGTYNDIYSNIKSASGSAESFSKLLNSSVLRSMVAKKMGQERFLGSARAEVLSDSNLRVFDT